jgi:hypothetical protein
MVVKLSGKVCAAAALIALAVGPLSARAVADAGSPVLTQIGGVMCSVSANDVPRGGGPMVTCQLSDGRPFPQAFFSSTKPNPRFNLAVVRASGEFIWDVGSVAGPQPLNLAAGQTYHINGWTIQADPVRSTYVYDATKHGMWIGPDLVHPLWV